MNYSLVIFLFFLLSIYGFYLARAKALSFKRGQVKLHSLPRYYGWYTGALLFVPVLVIILLWIVFQDRFLLDLAYQTLPESYHAQQQNSGLYRMQLAQLVYGVDLEASSALQQAAELFKRYQLMANILLIALLILSCAICGLWALKKIRPDLPARNIVELWLERLLLSCASLSVLITLGIICSVLFESILFFQKVPISEFLFGLNWSPQIAMRADQQGASGSFGAVPLFLGTVMISVIAMMVAVPFGLMSAVYLTEYAHPRVRTIIKPLLEILAGIPTVVYGVFAVVVVAPFIRDVGQSLGLNIASESALAAGLVMGVMIIPFVSSLSDDVINAVPQSLRDGSYALGATKAETVIKVILPAALPGVVGSILLAFSRAIGETMIVVMAAGLSANLTLNPLESVTTVTVQIVTLLVGDQEFDSPKTLAAFALGLILFIVTLILNMIALSVVRRYREQYE